MHRIVSGCLAVLACIMLAGSFFSSEAFAAPGQDKTAIKKAPVSKAPAAQQAEYVDEKGNKVVVTTFADGSIAVSVNDAAPVFGAEAVAVLASHGIALSVDNKGGITQHGVSGKTKVKAAPAPAAPATPAAPIVSQSFDRPVLPANVVAGSSVQSSSFASQVQSSTTNSDRLEESVSK